MKKYSCLHTGFILLTFLLFQNSSYAQDPTRFAEEVESLNQKEYPLDSSKPTVVFTGSSSIRFWTDVQTYYPGVNAINTGFGGSQFSDLDHYKNELIYRFEPDKIFIYEGDNDIAADKEILEITLVAFDLISDLREKLPDAEIYLISPKPSIARWDYKNRYEELNKVLKVLCDATGQLTYVDVWNPMLNDEGEPMSDIFIEDNLHMNEKGYQIWGSIIGQYLQDR